MCGGLGFTILLEFGNDPAIPQYTATARIYQPCVNITIRALYSAAPHLYHLVVNQALTDRDINRPQVRYITVPAADTGQRIDNFLVKHLKGAPTSLIYRLLRRGEIRVNKGRVKPTYRIQAEDEVRIPPIRLAGRDKLDPPPALCESIKQSVIFENERCMVINKPSGVPAHGGSGVPYGVAETVKAIWPDQYLQLVHRLDRGTSGCLLLAKDGAALRELQDNIHEMTKQYICLVRGYLDKTDITATYKLAADREDGEKYVRVAADDDLSAKTAITHFKQLMVYNTTLGRIALLQATLETGRTHQIRVHAQALGHPLAGDDRYGHRKFNRDLAKLGIKRLCLHAQHLGFTLDGKAYKVEAPVDERWASNIEKLKLLKP